MGLLFELSRSQHPDLADVINQIIDLPTSDLPAFLSSNIATWMWPRSDLHSWVKVLNKFDDVLKTYIEEYDLDGGSSNSNAATNNTTSKTSSLGLQTNPFTPMTKSVVIEILRFETLLLDNSTNRKLFSSYDVSSSSLHLPVLVHPLSCNSLFASICLCTAHQLSPLRGRYRYHHRSTSTASQTIPAILFSAIGVSDFTRLE